MLASHLFTLIGGLIALSIFLFFVMTVLKSKQAGHKVARKKVETLQAKISSSQQSPDGNNA